MQVHLTSPLTGEPLRLETPDRAQWSEVVRLEWQERRIFGRIRLPGDRNRHGRKYTGCNRYARCKSALEQVRCKLADARRWANRGEEYADSY